MADTEKGAGVAVSGRPDPCDSPGIRVGKRGAGDGVEACAQHAALAQPTGHATTAAVAAVAAEDTVLSAEALRRYRVGDIATAYYVPEWLSQAQESQLIERISGQPARVWTSLSAGRGRRLQNWGGVVRPGGMLAEPMPGWLSGTLERIKAIDGLFPRRLNHVLVNEYQPGQGIMPHTDGPLYHPVVAIVSLASGLQMRFLDKSTRRCRQTIWLAPRSLLLFSDDLYTTLLHHIDDVDEDVIDTSLLANHAAHPDLHDGQRIARQLRLSMTCRTVLKVLPRNLLRLVKT